MINVISSNYGYIIVKLIILDISEWSNLSVEFRC
ncbi:hypothetical protein FY526_27985 [Clostridioides difficile]|nr:hypothetical protein FY526_27985 [Clostridioides difficile]